MSRKRTHEEFLQEMKIINPNIEFLSVYTGAHNRIKCKCKIDGYIWNPEANSLLKGYGCSRCAKHESYSPEQFKSMVYNINPNIQLLSEYSGNQVPIKCRCNIDDYEWDTYPTHLLSGIGCAKCAGVITKTTQQFIRELFDINPYIEVIGEYTGNKNGIKCKCLIDGHIWDPSPNALLRGKGCPICNSSKGEKRVAKYLELNNINFKSQYSFDGCKNINNLLFDFYLPTYNIAIEYDGEYHSKIIKYKSESIETAKKRFLRQQNNDNIKNRYCDEHNIRLIRIPYTDFNEIENILDKYLF